MMAGDFGVELKGVIYIHDVLFITSNVGSFPTNSSEA